MFSNYQLQTCGSHIRGSEHYLRGITQFRMCFHLGGGLIDSHSHFRCNVPHPSRILIRCALGAIIICASVCRILRKMIERQRDSNLATAVKASVLFI